MYTYIHIYIYIYISLYTHTHTHIYIYPSIHTHTHIYIYIPLYTHTYIYIYIYPSVLGCVWYCCGSSYKWCLFLRYYITSKLSIRLINVFSSLTLDYMSSICYQTFFYHNFDHFLDEIVLNFDI